MIIHHCFTLYIAGHTPYTEQAIVNLRHLCETETNGDYTLEIVDILEHPDRAREGKILAIPTLIRELPRPMRRLIGDFTKRSSSLFEPNLAYPPVPKGL
ncbi:Circadian clock protein KaiB [Gammaproteobacteria bacterium]